MSLLELRDVSHRYLSSQGDLSVLNGVNLGVEAESVLAVVGESGCGKTTLGRLTVGMMKPSAGQVLFDGHDIWRLSRPEWKGFRRAVQVVHQDPYSSLNPGLPVGETLGAGLRYHKVVPRRALKAEMFRILEAVGLDATDALLQRYPHQLSGGQRQRLVIARAISLRPRLVVADEAVSMLDVSLRVSVLDLLLEMQKQYHLAYVFISHDFGVVRYMARGGRIVVMFYGVLVEEGPAEEVISRPSHPYTFLLLEAVPVPNPVVARQRRKRHFEERTDASPSPTGCVFSERCPFAGPECRSTRPPVVEVSAGHSVACFFPERVPSLTTIMEGGVHGTTGGEVPVACGNGDVGAVPLGAARSDVEGEPNRR